MIDWGDGVGAVIGSILGSAATILGFRGRMGALEKECDDLRAETRRMFKEIREDIKKLIAKAGDRRKDD